MTQIKGLLQEIRQGIDRENEHYQKQIEILKKELSELDHVDVKTEYFKHPVYS